MINIQKKICDTLAPLGHSIREQGTYSATETLPETFITFVILEQDDISHADNVSTGVLHSARIQLYSKRPATVQAAETALRVLMIPAGFLRAGGRPLPFEEQTGHYGYSAAYNFYDSEVE